MSDPSKPEPKPCDCWPCRLWAAGVPWHEAEPIIRRAAESGKGETE